MGYLRIGGAGVPEIGAKPRRIQMPSAKFFYQDPQAPKPNRPLSVGIIALIRREGSLLLERRSDSGRWGLIGGSVEIDESLDQALRREVYEETGLTVSSYRLAGTSSDPSIIVQYPDGSVVRVLALVYEAEVEDFSSMRCSEESTELRLCTREELRTLDIIETSRPVIDRYLAGGQLFLD
jgi:8-oxo-dGTP pyrophosphatase MutT (NUDIX family)